jgi:tRNA 2-thiouridine synthesizing protein A
MTDPEGNDPSAEVIIRELEHLRGRGCAGCGKPLCPHQMLMARAVGFKNAPRCLPCLGAALKVDPIGLRDDIFNYIRHRQCYAGAWDWANREAGLPDGVMPPALKTLGDAAENSPAPTPGDSVHATEAITACWDAGDEGCGELVLKLRLRLERMAPGEVFLLIARDLGAPEDLPAWCRLTGNTLQRAEHPKYWIQRSKK